LETKTISEKEVTQIELIYLLEKLVPLISIYAENYLKDSGYFLNLNLIFYKFAKD